MSLLQTATAKPQVTNVVDETTTSSLQLTIPKIQVIKDRENLSNFLSNTVQSELALSNTEVIDDISTTSATTIYFPAPSNAQFSVNAAALSPDFPQFSKLAAELQTMIWEATMRARLVHWRPGGGKAPQELLTNVQSRQVLKKHYTFITLGLPFRKKKYTILMNYSLDTLYRKRIRKPVRVGAIGPQACYIRPAWSQPVRFLAMDVAQLYGMACEDPDTGPRHIWFMMRLLFPNLEELVILSKLALKSTDTLDGLELGVEDDNMTEQEEIDLEIVHGLLWYHRYIQRYRRCPGTVYKIPGPNTAI